MRCSSRRGPPNAQQKISLKKIAAGPLAAEAPNIHACMHTCYACMHVMHACMHVLHVRHACIDAMHACIHVMHVMYACSFELIIFFWVLRLLSRRQAQLHYRL